MLEEGLLCEVDSFANVVIFEEAEEGRDEEGEVEKEAEAPNEMNDSFEEEKIGKREDTTSIFDEVRE